MTLIHFWQMGFPYVVMIIAPTVSTVWRAVPTLPTQTETRPAAKDGSTLTGSQKMAANQSNQALEELNSHLMNVFTAHLLAPDSLQ
mmetsp:Transcript_46233/g.133171  ORF Transcript_46233/g.133171 Transcript_46233/m.133171 type:complete len:86 (-) Transcript_46233:64-321(-)